MNVLAVRLAVDTVRGCLEHTPSAWHVVASRLIHRACEQVRGGRIDLVIANADMPPWDLHVLREVTALHATELLVLHEVRWPADLTQRLEQARSRRARHLDEVARRDRRSRVRRSAS